MGDKDDDLQSKIIQIGLDDPFVRVTAGLVAVAFVASSAISFFGDGLKTILAVGVTLIFGIIIVVLRVLVRDVDSSFLKLLCNVIAGSVTLCFVALTFFAIPAVVICRPQAYHDVLGLKACPTTASTSTEPLPGFTPVAFPGPGIVADPANGGVTILVFYRQSRPEDAERVVGALLSAGFKSQGVQSSLDEVLTDDRSPGSTLIKTSAAVQDRQPDVLRVVRLAIPILAARVRVYPQTMALARGDVQVDLF